MVLIFLCFQNPNSEIQLSKRAASTTNVTKSHFSDENTKSKPNAQIKFLYQKYTYQIQNCNLITVLLHALIIFQKIK